MPTTYILLDFENVQPGDLAPLAVTPCQLRVFVGSQQARLPTKFVMQVQELAGNAAYVEIEGQGRNALDFHIAYYMGKLAAEDPGCVIHVISNDTGFDVLLEYMRRQGIPCTRFKSLVELPQPSPGLAMSLAAKVELVADRLTRMKAAKPRTLRTLRSTVSKHFATVLAETELDDVIDALQSAAFFSIEKARIRYASDGG